MGCAKPLPATKGLQQTQHPNQCRCEVGTRTGSLYGCQDVRRKAVVEEPFRFAEQRVTTPLLMNSSPKTWTTPCALSVQTMPAMSSSGTRLHSAVARSAHPLPLRGREGVDGLAGERSASALWGAPS